MENSKYLNHLLNNDLSAKTMIRSLMILLKSECSIEMSVKRLVDCLIKAGEGFVYKDYEAFHALRYDFVDLTNRRIYEFDGEQHFDAENYFSGTYDKYIDSLNRDLLKQRIAKHLKFDVIRVSGKLKVLDFVDILNRCNLKRGQSLFIRDTYFEIIDSSLLKESHEVDLLEEIANLKLDIQRLNDKIEELTEENRYLTEEFESNDKRKVQEIDFNEVYKDLVEQFFNENYHKFDGIKRVSNSSLYALFNQWKQSKNIKMDVHQIVFIKQLIEPMSSIGYSLIRKQLRFNKSSNNVTTMSKYTLSMGSIKEKVVVSRYFEKQQDYITQEEVDTKLEEFKSNDFDDQNISDRDLIIYEYLKTQDQL